jgi:hypothetical protein
MSYLGVDLHTNSFTVCRRMKQDKESIRTFQIARIADFRKTLLKRDLLAVEARVFPAIAETVITKDTIIIITRFITKSLPYLGFIIPRRFTGGY